MSSGAVRARPNRHRLARCRPCQEISGKYALPRGTVGRYGRNATAFPIRPGPVVAARGTRNEFRESSGCDHRCVEWDRAGLGGRAGARGARVGVTARRADRLDELVREVRGHGRDDRGGRRATSPTARRRSRPSAAWPRSSDRSICSIANAGVGQTAGADPMNVPVVEQMVKVNLLGVAYAFEAVMESMLARKSGHLVAISSLAAYKGLPGSAGYCATKAAVNTYCEGLRIELHGRGVAVTCVCPGFVRTEMTAGKTHPMPFVMDADAAATRILRALPRATEGLRLPAADVVADEAARWLPDWFVARIEPVNRGEHGRVSDEVS